MQLKEIYQINVVQHLLNPVLFQASKVFGCGQRFLGHLHSTPLEVQGGNDESKFV